MPKPKKGHKKNLKIVEFHNWISRVPLKLGSGPARADVWRAGGSCAIVATGKTLADWMENQLGLVWAWAAGADVERAGGTCCCCCLARRQASNLRPPLLWRHHIFPIFAFFLSFLAAQNRFIGDLVPDRLTDWLSGSTFTFDTQRATQETCDIWDTWWPDQHFDNFWKFLKILWAKITISLSFFIIFDNFVTLDNFVSFFTIFYNLTS